MYLTIPKLHWRLRYEVMTYHTLHTYINVLVITQPQLLPHTPPRIPNSFLARPVGLLLTGFDCLKQHSGVEEAVCKWQPSEPILTQAEPT